MNESHEVEFLEYISQEDKILRDNLSICKEEMSIFNGLNMLFQKPLQHLDLSLAPMTEAKRVIFALYYRVLYQMHSSFSNILRFHISECYISIRIAIDSVLSAYRIMLEPDMVEKYINRDNYFLYIKSKMKREYDRDNSRYPLAQQLFSVHEICSQYGAHTDPETFVYRIKEGKDFLFFNFFQSPTNENEFRFNLFTMLLSYFSIFRIFKEYLVSELKYKDERWVEVDEWVGKNLNELKKKVLPKDETTIAEGE